MRVTSYRRAFLVTVAIVSLVFPSTTTSAQGGSETPTNVCSTVTVISTNAWAQQIGASDDVTPVIQAVTDQSGDNASSGAQTVTVTIVGPALGSMDSADIGTQVVCTATGISMSGTITRSADFAGAALQNVNWRPWVQLALQLHQPRIDVDASWQMQLTTGAEVTDAETPPYGDITYPLYLSATIP